MRYIDINGFDGDYKIDSNGDVYSYKFNEPRKLKTYLGGKGYPTVDLCKNGKYAKCTVHRLVAKHFVPNPNNLPEVNHEDGNKLNYHPSNLTWTDGVGNMKHAREVLGFNNKGENSPNSKLLESEVLDIIKSYNNGISSMILSKKYNIDYKHVHALVKRKFWKHLNIS